MLSVHQGSPPTRAIILSVRGLKEASSVSRGSLTVASTIRAGINTTLNPSSSETPSAARCKKPCVPKLDLSRV